MFIAGDCIFARKTNNMLPEMKIGVLGGGQLGAMILRHAIDYGLTVAILDASPDAPCAMYTSAFSCGDALSYDDVMAFGEGLDVLTIEKEAVNVEALKELERKGVKVYPSPDNISIIKNKYLQKQFLQRNGIPVVPGVLVEGRKALLDHKDKLPGCLKKCENGYDGNGVMMLDTVDDIARAFDVPSVLEEKVDIKYEISVIVSRNISGATSCYDPVLMVFNQERFLLDYQVAPAGISEELIKKSQEIALAIASALELVGILAVEMFVTESGELIVNELAPRPHNSGHHTIEACPTSQFEQHIRSVLGLPPGATNLQKAAVMINILQPVNSNEAFGNGEVLRQILQFPDTHVHWYGKKNSKGGRKVGHITITDSSIEKALSTAEQVRQILQ